MRLRKSVATGFGHLQACAALIKSLIIVISSLPFSCAQASVSYFFNVVFLPAPFRYSVPSVHSSKNCRVCTFFEFENFVQPPHSTFCATRNALNTLG